MLCGGDCYPARQHNVTTDDKYANLPNKVVHSLKNGTSAVHDLSEVINSLEDEQCAHDEESADPDAASSHLSIVEQFQSLAEPHIDYITASSDEEHSAVTKFVDETQALGCMAAEISSRRPSVA